MSETLERPKVRQAAPFLMVTDMPRALAFYREGLGFEIRTEWRPDGELRWCWLQRDDVGLMLQAYLPGRRPPGPLGQGVTLVFMCDDALHVWREAKARGLEPDRPYVGNGMWVTEISDPDGYRMLFESPTDAAEESVYDGD